MRREDNNFRAPTEAGANGLGYEGIIGKIGDTEPQLRVCNLQITREGQFPPQLQRLKISSGSDIALAHG